MPYLTSTSIGAVRAKVLGSYLTSAVLIATVCGFAGYGAAVSYAAFFKIEGVDPRKIGEHTFYIVGCLALIGALVLATVRG